ncbi:MAG: hypothetical protein ABL932_26445, partial [Terricaulis sp.]
MSANYVEALSSSVANGAVLDIPRAISVNTDVVSFETRPGVREYIFGEYLGREELRDICAADRVSDLAVRFNFRRQQSGAYDVARGYESATPPSRVEFADCEDADLSALAMRFRDER